MPRSNKCGAQPKIPESYANFDVAGFQNTLKLRAEIQGDWGATPSRRKI